MPILRLETSKPLSKAELAHLASKLTFVTKKTLRKDPAITVVIIEAPSPEKAWFVAGEQSGAVMSNLSIQITEGANTDEEKADWLRSVADLLEIPDDALPHYLTVIEVPGTDWGFNGISQAARKELNK